MKRKTKYTLYVLRLPPALFNRLYELGDASRFPTVGAYMVHILARHVQRIEKRTHKKTIASVKQNATRK